MPHGSIDAGRASSRLDLVLYFVHSELHFYQLCSLEVEDGAQSLKLEMNTFLEQLELHSIGCLRFLQRPLCLRALSSQLNHSPSLFQFPVTAEK